MTHRYMNVDMGRQNIIINNDTNQFPFWENINWNHTYVLDSYRHFICSVWEHAKLVHIYRHTTHYTACRAE